LHGKQVGNHSNRSVGHIVPGDARKKHREAMMAVAAHINHYAATSGTSDSFMASPFVTTMNKVCVPN